MSATANVTYFKSGIGVQKSDGTYVDCIDANGNVDAPVSTTAPLTITGANASALAVGAHGATNPVLKIDTNTASVATGLSVTGAAAAGGLALAVISSGTNESLKLDAKGSGAITVGGTSTGLVHLGQGSASQSVQGGAIASLGTTQNSSPTAAQLLGGIVTQTSATGAGTVTLPTGTAMDTAVPGVATGDSFRVRFANLGGGQTLTVTAASGFTVVGTATVATATNIDILCVRTGANTWVAYTNK